MANSSETTGWTPSRLSRRRLLQTAATAGAVSGLGLVGCGSFGTAGGGDKIGGTLTVTSYGGAWEEYMRGSVVPGFEKKYPGTKVELAIGLSKDWVAKIRAAGKDNSPYDIIVTNEVWAAPVRDAGFFVKLPIEQAPNLKEIAPNLRMKDDVGVLSLVGPIGIAYRADKIKTAPKSWKDLWAQAEYKGNIGGYNIGNSAGQMFMMLTGKLWNNNDKDVDTIYKKLGELKPFKQTDFSGDMEKLLIQGEVTIGILDYPAARRLKLGGAPIEWVKPEEGMLMFEQDVNVLTGSKNKATAFAFVNYFLDREVQSGWVEKQNYLPGNIEVKVPDDFAVKPADIPKILQWDWLWFDNNRQMLVDRWNKEISS